MKLYQPLNDYKCNLGINQNVLCLFRRLHKRLFDALHSIPTENGEWSNSNNIKPSIAPFFDIIITKSTIHLSSQSNTVNIICGFNILNDRQIQSASNPHKIRTKPKSN